MIRFWWWLIPCWLLATTPLQQAKHLFDQGDYERSFALFGALVSQGSENKETLFYLGRSAYALQKYTIALHAFQEANRIDTDDIRIRLEIAATLLAMQRYDESRALFESLLETSETLPDNVVRNIKRHLVLLERKAEQNQWRFLLGLGGFYDDNIHQAPASSSHYLPSLDGIVDLSQAEQEAYGIQSLAKIQWGGTWEQQPFEFSSLLLDRTHNEASGEDLTYLRLHTSAPHLLFAMFTPEVALGHLFYGGESYAWDLEAGVHWQQQWDSDQITIRTAVSQREHKEKNHEKDFTGFRLQTNWERKLHNWQPYATIGYQRDWERYPARSDVAKQSFWGSIGLRTQLTKKLAVAADITYRHTDYQDVDIHFLNRREDRQIRFQTRLRTALNPQWQGELEWQHTHNESNHSPFDYNKNRIGFWLIYIH